MVKRVSFKEGVHSFYGALKFNLISGSVTIFGASVTSGFSSKIFVPFFQLPIPIFSEKSFCIEFLDFDPDEINPDELAFYQTIPDDFTEIFPLVYHSPGNRGPAYQTCLLNKINELLNFNNPTRIFLFGGKGVGKSTLAHFLVNTLKSSAPIPLNSKVPFLDYFDNSKIDPSNDTTTNSDAFYSDSEFPNNDTSNSNSIIDRKICFIDLDPGQPSISFPTTLSYTTNCPFIFNSSEHNCFLSEAKYSVHSPNISKCIQPFLESISQISQQLKNLNELGISYSIINSHGWIENDGLKLQKKMIENLEPDLVIYLHRPNEQPEQIHHNQLNVVINTRKCTQSKSPRALRQIRYAKYFMNNSFTIPKPYCLSIKQFNYSFPQDINILNCLRDIPRILNGSLVNLCFDDTSYQTSSDISNALFRITKPKYMKCYGMGFIRSIDIQKQKLYIITPEKEEIMQTVNTLVYITREIPISIFRDTRRFKLTYAEVNSQ